MTPAGKLQAHLKKRVTETSGHYRKVKWEGRNGCPDCFVWWQWPALAFIEIKAPGDRYSVLQMREIARLRESGIPVFTARSIEEIDGIVEKVRLTR